MTYYNYIHPTCRNFNDTTSAVNTIPTDVWVKVIR